MSNVLNRIDNVLMQRGITRYKLSKTVNIPESTIRGWRKTCPSAERLTAVAEYLGVSVQWLLTGEEAGEPVDQFKLSEEETNIIKKYRLLKPKLKDSIKTIIDGLGAEDAETF